MQSVGQKLREARLRRQLTLELVSSNTRISLKNLHAIESDDLALISSVFFYKSFVRQFAEEVKLDYELELADAVQEVANKLPAPLIPGQGDAPLPKGKSIRAHKPMRWRWLSSVGALVVMVVACSTLYAMWESSKSTLGSRVEAMVQQLASAGKKVASLSPDAEKAGSAKQSTVAARKPSSTEAGTAVPPLDSAAADQPATSDQAQSAASNSGQLQEPPSEPSTAHGENGYKIELDATERSWLSVTADGKQVYNGILQPDETKVLEGRDSARLRTGNAGGIQVVFNGKPIGTLGARGQVRTVVFTKDHYEIVDGADHIALIRFSPSGGQ